MPLGLIAVGLNHQTATVVLREQFSLAVGAIPPALQRLQRRFALSQVMLLCTCNRTDLYAIRQTSDEIDPAAMLRGLLPDGVSAADLQGKVYCYTGWAALAHMIRVASGLDSMVLGESQIQGQFKTAFAQARDAGAVDKELLQLISHVLASAKRVRRETAIGETSQSLADAAVAIGLEQLHNKGDIQALLLGAGTTIERVAVGLAARQGVKFGIVNRSIERAQTLAAQFAATAVPLEDLYSQLAQVDLVVAATASPRPLIAAAPLAAIMQQRVARPLLIIDIAVPRDVEPAVGQVAAVQLMDLDSLRSKLQRGPQQQALIAQADALVAAAVDAYCQRLQSRQAVATLTAFREKLESLRQIELQRAQRALDNGMPAGQVLELLSRSLTNKLLHQPSIALKQAGAEGRQDMVDLSRHLFDLDDDSEI